jgi:hypothetical protein
VLASSCLGAHSLQCVSIAEDRKTVVLACKPTNKHFTFDHAAGEDSTQEELFEEVGKPVTQVILQLSYRKLKQ